MVRLGKKTKQTPQEVLDQAETFFGPENVGLELRQRDAQSVIFEGGGGYITITAMQSEGQTDVNIESREWDYQARQFLGKL